MANPARISVDFCGSVVAETETGRLWALDLAGPGEPAGAQRIVAGVGGHQFFVSLGVEAGHFLFIGVVLTLIAAARRVKWTAPQWAQLVPPYAVGSVAMFWVIQRIAAF